MAKNRGLNVGQVILSVAFFLGSTLPAFGQVTPQEYEKLQILLKEPDGKEAYERRLKILADAYDRFADPTKRLSSGYGVTAVFLRIPPEVAIPFYLKYTHHPVEYLRISALRDLSDFGTKAKEASPHIRQLIDDRASNVSEHAMKTIARIDPTNREVVQTILKRLETGPANDSWQRSALMALVEMADTVPKSAVPMLIPFLEHRWVETQTSAFELVGKVLNLERPTLEQLRTMDVIDWRKAEDQGYSVLRAIQEAGTKADFAMPLLVELLTASPPLYLECKVVQTLAKVKTGHPRMISAVLDRLVAKEPTLAEFARQALDHFDYSQPKSIRALALGLRHADEKVRYEAAVKLRALDQLKKLDELGRTEVWPALLATLRETTEDTHPGYLSLYVHLLKGYGKQAEPARETLERFYRSDTYFQRHANLAKTFHIKSLLVVTMTNLGFPKSQKDSLEKLLKEGFEKDSEKANQFAAAARALGSLGAEAEGAIPLLLPVLTFKGPEISVHYVDFSTDRNQVSSVRAETIRAIARIGPSGRVALPHLREWAEKKEVAFQPGETGNYLLNLAIREARLAVQALEKK